MRAGVTHLPGQQVRRAVLVGLRASPEASRVVSPPGFALLLQTCDCDTTAHYCANKDSQVLANKDSVRSLAVPLASIQDFKSDSKFNKDASAQLGLFLWEVTEVK
jgi:hypothetical protein